MTPRYFPHKRICSLKYLFLLVVNFKELPFKLSNGKACLRTGNLLCCIWAGAVKWCGFKLSRVEAKQKKILSWHLDRWICQDDSLIVCVCVCFQYHMGPFFIHECSGFFFLFHLLSLICLISVKHVKSNQIDKGSDELLNQLLMNYTHTYTHTWWLHSLPCTHTHSSAKWEASSHLLYIRLCWGEGGWRVKPMSLLIAAA